MYAKLGGCSSAPENDDSALLECGHHPPCRVATDSPARALPFFQRFVAATGCDDDDENERERDGGGGGAAAQGAGGNAVAAAAAASPSSFAPDQIGDRLLRRGAAAGEAEARALLGDDTACDGSSSG